ncbi:sensor histidine kinase [Salinactinospora qingdaonensis]|uniref:histidine kinase n=1 Tax=Salinactinospora qingdaonensis TaxID=702744 RepID=A0ABP7FYK6_9ACTN
MGEAPAAVPDAAAAPGTPDEPALRPWQRRVFALLHLLTTFALAPLYLLPAVLLFAGVNQYSTEVYDALTGQWSLPGLLAATVALLVLPLSLLLARLCCWLQKRRLAAMFGIRETSLTASREDRGAVAAAVAYLFGREAWTALLACTLVGLVGCTVGLLAFALVAYGIGTAVGTVLAVGYVLLGSMAGTLSLTSIANLAMPLVLAAPAPLLLALGIWSAPTLARPEIALARRLLFDPPDKRVRHRLVHLQDTRLRMVDAAEAERRRIERDLHDGAQQRLLAVTMTLTRARAKFDRSPEQARALLVEAQEEAKAVMAELREVARGLHPRVLSDHGLSAALPVAAGRCPVPVWVDVDLPKRPSSRAEGIAYYVSCEALTNIAKHAQATTVRVRCERVARRRGDLLRVVVTDDGVGGADPETGTGLYGLWDRVNAVDGTLVVDSPAGGGTVLTADIPWEA